MRPPCARGRGQAGFSGSVQTPWKEAQGTVLQGRGAAGRFEATGAWGNLEGRAVLRPPLEQVGPPDRCPPLVPCGYRAVGVAGVTPAPVTGFTWKAWLHVNASPLPGLWGPGHTDVSSSFQLGSEGPAQPGPAAVTAGCVIPWSFLPTGGAAGKRVSAPDDARKR